MFELFEIARNSNFEKYQFNKKVLPVMLEFIDFSKPEVLDIYLSFWQKEFAKWDDLIKNKAEELSTGQFERYEKIKLVRQNFSKLADWLVDLNTLNPTLLSGNNFSEIKRTLLKDNTTQNTHAKQETKPISVSNGHEKRTTVLPKWAYISLTTLSFSAVLIFTWYILIKRPVIPPSSFFLLLIIFGICVSFMLFGLTEIAAGVSGNILGLKIRAGGPLAGLITVILLGLWLNAQPDKHHTFTVQLNGPGGVSDVPLKNVNNGITLIPVNRQEIVKDINKLGIATFELDAIYESDSIKFKLDSDQFELIEAGKYFKINQGDKITLTVRRRLVLFNLKFLDKNLDPIAGVVFKCGDLQIDTVSDSNGLIKRYADTTGLQTYTFSVKPPAGYKQYNDTKRKYIQDIAPIFYFEKEKK
jgi:hypothetical protein